MTPRLVLNNLFVSGHTRGLAPHRSLEILAEHSITRVVCVAPQPDQHLAQEMWTLGLCYDHIPLSDGKTISPALVRSLARELTLDLVTRRVLIHCNAGRNRAPFVAALVMIYQGTSAIDAITHIRRLRPTALANEHFVKFLMEEHE